MIVLFGVISRNHACTSEQNANIVNAIHVLLLLPSYYFIHFALVKNDIHCCIICVCKFCQLNFETIVVDNLCNVL